MSNSDELQEVIPSMSNLLLDEITGQKVSKTELKKRQKLRQRSAKKTEKAATEPLRTEGNMPTEREEANLASHVSAFWRVFFFFFFLLVYVCDKELKANGWVVLFPY